MKKAVELLYDILPELRDCARDLEQLVYNPILEGLPVRIDPSRLVVDSPMPFLEMLQSACTDVRAQTVGTEDEGIV
jgi:hypothetical protein